MLCLRETFSASLFDVKLFGLGKDRWEERRKEETDLVV